MIHAFTGRPRSGKTLLLIKRIIEYVFQHDSEKKSEFIRSISYRGAQLDYKGIAEGLIGDVRLVSNIDGLKFPHNTLQDLISAVYGEDCPGEYKKQGDLLFSDETFDFLDKQLSKEEKKRGVRWLIVIDEVQRLLPRNGKQVSAYNALQLHGHYAVDLYLATQDVKTCAQELKPLIEFEYRAVSRSLAFIGEFKYIEKAADIRCGTEMLSKPWVYWQVYKSSSSHKKVKSSARKYLYLLVITVSIAGFMGYRTFTNPFRATVAEAQRVIDGNNPDSVGTEETPGYQKKAREKNNSVMVPASFYTIDSEIYVVTRFGVVRLKELEITQYKRIFSIKSPGKVRILIDSGLVPFAGEDAMES